LPTATHCDPVPQLTPLRKLFWLGEVFGLETIDHTLPFQDRMIVWAWSKRVPTATQLVGPAHATSLRRLGWLEDALGLGTMVHTLPFHDSMSVWLLAPMLTHPTAKQLVGPVHVTPLRLFDWPDEVLGLETMDHTLPFHDSTRVWLFVPLENCPTATQFVALVHATLSRMLSWLGDVFGLGAMDHALPFHDSMRVWLFVPLKNSPTATQFVGLVHATLSRTFSWLDDVFGLGTMDHTLPFHDSMRV
jgi:hypothetical protein